MLTVECAIAPMRYAASLTSGTVRWSVLLPTGSKTWLTRLGSGLEGSVRQVLPVRYISDDCVAGTSR